MKSKALFAILILLVFPLVSACSTRELNTFSLVTALGIDKDEAGYIVTYQVLNPKAVAANNNSNESRFILYSEKGNDFSVMERRVTTQAARRMFFSHVRSVVISEDVARDGLKEILEYLSRAQGFRSDYYFLIAKGATANQILGTMATIEPVSGIKLFNSIKNSGEYWAPTNSLRIPELINDINARGKNPVLAGIEFYQKTEDMDSVKGMEKTNPGKLRFTELGVFRDDKLIGWLGESEILAFNSIVGKTKSSAISVDYNDSTHVSLDIEMKKTKTRVFLSSGKPVINVIFSAEMDFTTTTGDVDFTKKENLDKLKGMINKKIIDASKKMLVKAQQELKTDIFGFGESIHRAYPKVWNELKNNWDTEFTALRVNFMIDTKIRDFGSFMKSIIIEEE